MFTDQLITVEEHQVWFQHMMVDTSVMYWIVGYDGRDVGVLNISGIDRRNRRCYWGFYLADPEVRGKGIAGYVEYWIMRYVFDELGLNKLCGEVLASNQAVADMHVSFGYTREGLLREHVMKRGAPEDVICLSVLYREWEALRPKIEGRLRRRGML